MKNKKENNLLTGNLFKTIIKLGTPIALGSLAQTLYNLADAFWLGKLGREALAAPIISFFILFFLISIGFGFSISGTSLVSQYTGAGEPQKANRTAGNLLIFLVVVSTVLGGLGLYFARDLLTLMKTPADTFDITLSYYRIVMTGMPLYFPMFVFQSVMNGYGDTMSPLKISLATAAINLIIDPILIFGWLGFPAMGVSGAAFATVLTRSLASCIGIYLFFSGKKGIKLTLKDLKPDISISKLMIKIGTPTAIGFSGSSLGFMVLMGIVNPFGTAVVSAYGIGTRVIHFFMLPAMGISSAVTAIVGQNLGAGQIQRARYAVSRGIYLMLILITPFLILTAIFGREVTALFIPEDQTVLGIGQIMFLISAPSVLFFGISSVLEGTFHGAGHTIPVMVTQICRLWIFRIPLVYAFSMVLMNGPHDVNAAEGIWWGMVLSNAGALLIIYTWYSKSNWTKARIKESAPKEQ